MKRRQFLINSLLAGTVISILSFKKQNMITVVVISEEEIDKIKGLAKFAEENALSMDDVLDTLNKQKLPVGDDERFVVELSNGIKIVYSIENQEVGVVKHLSVSVKNFMLFQI